MNGKCIRLSPIRRFICDLLHAARGVPTVPAQRRMKLARLVMARAKLTERPPWSVLFAKAYASVAAAVPELRRAYVKFPWPHLYEYPVSTVSLAIEREYGGEKVVFIPRIKDPAALSLAELSRLIRRLQHEPLESNKEFRRVLWLSRRSLPVRRLLWWLGLNLGRQRGNYFGTFAISVYSGLGAESLHPLSPVTTTLNYGVIAPDGEVDVRIIYDHRVMDGATVAHILKRLEAELNDQILAELQSLAPLPGRAAGCQIERNPH